MFSALEDMDDVVESPPDSHLRDSLQPMLTKCISYEDVSRFLSISTGMAPHQLPKQYLRFIQYRAYYQSLHDIHKHPLFKKININLLSTSVIVPPRSQKIAKAPAQTSYVQLSHGSSTNNTKNPSRIANVQLSDPIIDLLSFRWPTFHYASFPTLNTSRKAHSIPALLRPCVDYYVVLDFECTCTDIDIPNFTHEIIEFPAVLVDAHSMSIVSTFRSYVRPVEFPKLTSFCTKLTGITQHQVDQAPPLELVLLLFREWLLSYGILFPMLSKTPDITQLQNHAALPPHGHIKYLYLDEFSNIQDVQTKISTGGGGVPNRQLIYSRYSSYAYQSHYLSSRIVNHTDYFLHYMPTLLSSCDLMVRRTSNDTRPVMAVYPVPASDGPRVKNHVCITSFESPLDTHDGAQRIEKFKNYSIDRSNLPPRLSVLYDNDEISLSYKEDGLFGKNGDDSDDDDDSDSDDKPYISPIALTFDDLFTAASLYTLQSYGYKTLQDVLQQYALSIDITRSNITHHFATHLDELQMHEIAAGKYPNISPTATSTQIPGALARDPMKSHSKGLATAFVVTDSMTDFSGFLQPECQRKNISWLLMWTFGVFYNGGMNIAQYDSKRSFLSTEDDDGNEDDDGSSNANDKNDSSSVLDSTRTTAKHRGSASSAHTTQKRGGKNAAGAAGNPTNGRRRQEDLAHAVSSLSLSGSQCKENENTSNSNPQSPEKKVSVVERVARELTLLSERARPKYTGDRTLIISRAPTLRTIVNSCLPSFSELLHNSLKSTKLAGLADANLSPIFSWINIAGELRNRRSFQSRRTVKLQLPNFYPDAMAPVDREGLIPMTPTTDAVRKPPIEWTVPASVCLFMSTRNTFRDMPGRLQSCGLKFLGQQHSGLCDSINIARVLMSLAFSSDVLFTPNLWHPY